MREILNARKRHVRIVTGFIFVLFVIVLLFAIRPLRQVIRGIQHQNMPLSHTREALLDSLKRDGVGRIEVDVLDDTSYYYESESGFNDVHFTYTVFDDMYLLIGQYGSQHDLKLFDGGRQSLVVSYQEQGYHRQLTQDIAAAIAQGSDASANDVRPYIFDEVVTLEGFRPNVIPALIFIMAPLLWMVAYYAIFSYKAIHDLEKRLSPEAMAQLDESISNAQFKTKKVVVSDTYFVQLTGGNLSKTLLLIDDIAWVYPFVLTQRYYGIKIRKHYILKVFVEGKKKPIDVACSNDDAMDDLIEALLEQKPNILVGYKKAYLQNWKQNRSGARLKTVVDSQQSPD